MSENKVELLLHVVDRVRIAALDAADELGLPQGHIALFFQRPRRAEEWILELAMQGDAKAPALLKVLTEMMPEPGTVTVRRRQARHDGARDLPPPKPLEVHEVDAGRAPVVIKAGARMKRGQR